MDHLSDYHEDDVDTHQCESYRDGDWIVFLCPKCEGYERRLNWRSGEMKVRDRSDQNIRHTGEYFPEEVGYAFTSQN